MGPSADGDHTRCPLRLQAASPYRREPLVSALVLRSHTSLGWTPSQRISESTHIIPCRGPVPVACSHVRLSSAQGRIRDRFPVRPIVSWLGGWATGRRSRWTSISPPNRTRASPRGGVHCGLAWFGAHRDPIARAETSVDACFDSSLTCLRPAYGPTADPGAIQLHLIGRRDGSRRVSNRSIRRHRPLRAHHVAASRPGSR